MLGGCCLVHSMDHACSVVHKSGCSPRSGDPSHCCPRNMQACSIALELTVACALAQVDTINWDDGRSKKPAQQQLYRSLSTLAC
jgi:hypothetical protein